MPSKYFKGFISKLASSFFIIFGLLSIIAYILIPQSDNYVLEILRNLFNALGAILIVGGIFESIFKEKFIEEVSNKFVKAIFLKPSTLNNFKDKELEEMNKNIQSKLLKKNKNNTCSVKIISMINNSFYQMAKGTHDKDEFNTFFQYYNSMMYVNKKTEESQETVEIEFILKYEIINNKKDKETVNVGIFAKRFFPLSLSSKENCITQELISLSIKKDNESIKDYSEDIKNNKFKEIIVEKEERDSIKIQEAIKRQIQYKKDGDADFSPFEVDFHHKMIVEKKIKVVTLFNDITYSQIFNRPILNYSIQYYDENVSSTDKDYLTLKLFSGLNKKVNDKIHPILKGNLISLNISDGILLPGEGINIVALRK